MATGDLKIDALFDSSSSDKPLWGNPTSGSPLVISFSFMAQVPGYYEKNAPERNNFIALDQAQQQGARQALQLWAEVANIKFAELKDTGHSIGQITFGTSRLGTPDVGGYTIRDYRWTRDGWVRQPKAGDIWLNNNDSTNHLQAPGEPGFMAMIHELGHALGLKHPGRYDGGDGGPFLPGSEDNFQYTVMSYNDGQDGRVKYTGSSSQPQTPLLYDIAAIQHLYGANMTVRTGDDVYRWDTDQNFVSAIWDAGGNDTIDASNQTHQSLINLTAGSFSSIGFNKNTDIKDNLAIAYNVTIENANGGSANDEITGNDAQNILRGNGGNDRLIGGGSGDTFLFKSAAEGTDTIEDFNRQEGDKIRFDAEAKASQFKYNAETGEVSFDDQVFAVLANKPADFTIGTDLVFNPSTSPEPSPVTPPITPDFLSGSAGNDQLLGQAGNDTMNGGLGDDFYTVDSSADITTEALNSGNDTVSASIGYTLADNVENLTLTGNYAIDGTGNSLNNIITGNAENNYLYAGDGADEVNGQAGNDYLYGQAGDDLLSGGKGKDWLVGDLGDDILSGGTGNDRLIGGLGNNTLSADQGKDRLTGGADADQFILSSSNKNSAMITNFHAAQGDKIIFSAQGLNQQVKRGKLSSDQFTLGSTAEHEKAGFIYNKSSGRLFFDVDGIGDQHQVQIAKLASGTALCSNNIFVRA